MIRLLAIASLVLTAASATLPYPNYGASALQRKVDLSFSAVPINTTLAKAKARLKLIPASCEEYDNCQWADPSGVRHYIWGEDTAKMVVIKFVHADEFKGRPIRALGIGRARSKAAVIKAVKAFDRRIKLDCDNDPISGNVGPQECSFTAEPGWIQIGFDQSGQLLKVRFDGYYFT